MNLRVLLSVKAIPVLVILAIAIAVFANAPKLYKFTRFYDPSAPDPQPGTFDKANVVRAIRFFSGAMILLMASILILALL